VARDAGLERNILAQARVDLSTDPSLRLFRNQAGQAWAGPWHYAGRDEVAPWGSVIITDPYRVSCGLVEGAGDLLGWQRRFITTSMIGQSIAVFTSLEAKSTRGRLTEPQKNWIKQLLADGGIAGMFRNSAEARAIIDGPR